CVLTPLGIHISGSFTVGPAHVSASLTGWLARRLPDKTFVFDLDGGLHIDFDNVTFDGGVHIDQRGLWIGGRLDIAGHDVPVTGSLIYSPFSMSLDKAAGSAPVTLITNRAGTPVLTLEEAHLRTDPSGRNLVLGSGMAGVLDGDVPISATLARTGGNG